MSSTRRQKLTRQLIDSIPPGPTEIFLWDSEVPGLYLRILPTNVRTWGIQYRNADGRTRRMKIGRYQLHRPDEVRVEARARLVQADHGNDPSAERRGSRHGTTLAEFWVRYLRDGTATWKPRTRVNILSLWHNKISPIFGSRVLSRLTRSEIQSWHASMSARKGAANHALRALSACLGRAVEWGVIPANPAANIRPYPGKKMETFLTAPQLQFLLLAIDQEEAAGAAGQASQIRMVHPDASPVPGRGGPGMVEVRSRGISTHAAALFRLLLLTGARLSEIRTAQWGWIDWQRRVLRLPDSKTGAKNIQLPAPAIEELRRLEKIRTQPRYIIEGRDPLTCLEDASPSWQRIRLAAAMAIRYHLAQPRLPGVPIPSIDPEPMARLRIHDLRHSFASFGINLGLSLPHIGGSLGHTQSRTTERYAHLTADPIRDASDTIAAYIDKIRRSDAV